MKKFNLIIKPKEGIGDLKFGTTIEEVIKKVGEADELEDFNDEDCFNTKLLSYLDDEVDLFFEGNNNFVFSAISVDNKEASLYGKKIFELSEKEIIELMKENGFNLSDTTIDEEFCEKCLSFEDAYLDFYFNKDNELISLNFGVLVSDDGKILDI
ncbi:MAG: hypothetical protein ACOX4D_06940 [Bacteroidales bacterium]